MFNITRVLEALLEGGKVKVFHHLNQVTMKLLQYQQDSKVLLMNFHSGNRKLGVVVQEVCGS